MTLPMELTAEAEPSARFEHRVAPLIDDLYGQARRLTRQHADAEDLVQDTLVNALAGFGSFEAESNIHAWLHRIMVNTHISNLRKLQRRPALQSTSYITDAQVMVDAAHSAVGLSSAEDQALRRLGSQNVITAMRALPEQFRTAVYYADIEGLDCREIAARMHTPIGTVVSRLHRGRRQLRRLLAQADVSEGYGSSQWAQTA